MNGSTNKSEKKLKKKYMRQMKMKTMAHNLWVPQSCSKREVYSDTGLPQEEKKKISNKQCNITPKGARKIRINKTPKR